MDAFKGFDKNLRCRGYQYEIVDGEKIKANVWYRLDKAGRFIKAKN